MYYDTELIVSNLPLTVPSILCLKKIFKKHQGIIIFQYGFFLIGQHPNIKRISRIECCIAGKVDFIVP